MDGLTQVHLLWLFSDQTLGFMVRLSFDGALDCLQNLRLLSFWSNHQSFSIDVRLSDLKLLGFFLLLLDFTRNGYIMVDLRHSLNFRSFVHLTVLSESISRVTLASQLHFLAIIVVLAKFQSLERSSGFLVLDGFTLRA